jgi:nitrite reductase/ring-hydroxylating ferredoxin subunit
MHSAQFEVQIDAAARSQIVTGIDDLELILVRHRPNEWSAFLNNCADEMLSLNREGSNHVLLNSAGQLICEHHAARFAACDGCLIATGNAHHADRLASGLDRVPVEVNGNTATFTISSTLRARWHRVKSIRYRKSFGRGPSGSCRYWLARLQCLTSGNG